ncbi:unnamed protein product [Phaeothamnion confervicola]
MAVEMNLRSYKGWAGMPAAPKLGTLRVEDALNWRNEHGVKQFSERYVKIRTMLAAPASLGSLERDFCMAGRLTRPNRTSLRPRHVEMRTFLNANIDAIPALDWIPALSAEAAEMAMPVRLQDPEVFKVTAALFHIQPAAGVEGGVDEMGASEMRRRRVPMMRRSKVRMKHRRPTVFS